jgi:hypothetical protein
MPTTAGTTPSQPRQSITRAKLMTRHAHQRYSPDPTGRTPVHGAHDVVEKPQTAGTARLYQYHRIQYRWSYHGDFDHIHRSRQIQAGTKNLARRAVAHYQCIWRNIMAHLARGRDMRSICRTRHYSVALTWWQSTDLALGNRTTATPLPSDNKPLSLTWR